MAGRNGSSYRFFAQSIENEPNGFASDEFDESDVWGFGNELRSANSIKNKPIPSSRSNRKRTEKGDRVTAAASLPVNIPDWSKILKHEYKGGNSNNNSSFDGRLFDEDEEDGKGAGVLIPPHELLWRRNRGASFSVHEGIGCTLKGRDLRRVRNAIFEKTGIRWVELMGFFGHGAWHLSMIW